MIMMRDQEEQGTGTERMAANSVAIKIRRMKSCP
jgi:hypothetical protein